MWYVINKQNGKKLHLFEKNVITPFFEYMIKYKQKKETGNFDTFLIKLQKQNNQKLLNIEKIKYKIHFLEAIKIRLELENKRIDIMIYIYKRKHEGLTFSNQIEQLLKLDENQLKKQYYIYLYQKREIKKKTTFIQQFNNEIREEWRVIFCQFYYKKFFNHKRIWEKIGCERLTRDDFHNNFRNDNDLYVCPYCDLVLNTDNGNLEIEHFWPSSKYPFLAMNSLNLYSVCKSCNSPQTGKGFKVINPITMPGYEEIGKKVKFEIDAVDKKINISSKNKKDNNYIKLLQIQRRYSTEGVYKHINNKIEGIYQTLEDSKKKKILTNDENDIQKYIENINKPKETEYYFILSDILKKYKK